MNRSTLYVANLPPDIDEPTLGELFAQFGEVLAIEGGMIEKLDAPYALVEMGAEKIATKALNALNGYDLGGYRLAVSYPEPDLTREMTSKQRKAAAEIAADLQEVDSKPVRQIEAMVLLCGASFARVIADEAREVFATQGLNKEDGAQRSLGGVFFYLARFRMTQPLRSIVYHRKGKLPHYSEQESEPQDNAEAG